MNSTHIASSLRDLVMKIRFFPAKKADLDSQKYIEEFSFHITKLLKDPFYATSPDFRRIVSSALFAENPIPVSEMLLNFTRQRWNYTGMRKTASFCAVMEAFVAELNVHRDEIANISPALSSTEKDSLLLDVTKDLFKKLMHITTR